MRLFSQLLLIALDRQQLRICIGLKPWNLCRGTIADKSFHFKILVGKSTHQTEEKTQ
jgi:hypothetical protein